jgi:hypothetical protein
MMSESYWKNEAKKYETLLLGILLSNINRSVKIQKVALHVDKSRYELHINSESLSGDIIISALEKK